MITAIDLFCGAGGLTHGLVRGGITVSAGVDADDACKYPFEYNNGAKFILTDVAEFTKEEAAKYLPNDGYFMLAGCAPCQPFSLYTQGKDPSSDSKWGLLNHFSRLTKELEPDFVTMENVPNLRKQAVFHDFVDALKAQGYSVSCQVVACHHYGLPQLRERLVLLASKHGDVAFPEPTHTQSDFVTVRDTIAGLPPIEAGECSCEDSLHKASALSEINQKRIRASRPGGTWREWPKDLRAKCHQKESGKTYSSVYGRMSWDEPSPTMTTQCFGFGNGRFGHPEQNRGISLREAALLQTFPATYEFVPPSKPVQMKNVGRLIGNAVPVKLGEIIASVFVDHARQLAE